jgi:iron complex outermembrane receptor protein
MEWVLLLLIPNINHLHMQPTLLMDRSERHTPHKSQHTLCVGALLCLSVFPSTRLLAQTSTQDLKEIVVQSGRLEQKRFDAPASIYTVDADTLRNSGPQVNISDVLNSAPGVVALNRNNYAQDLQISIRGFGSRSAFGLRGIRLIADGIPASMPDGQGQASTVSMTSADRMEVLTGPLALLYGNASGGVIQTYTREAGDTPEARVAMYAGSFGMTRTDWQISQRSGNVGLVADYSTFAIDGYRTNSDARRQQLNSVITVDAQPDTRIKFVVNVFDMPYAKDALGLTAAQLASNAAQSGTGALDARTRKTVKQEQLGAVLEHTVNSDLKLQGRIYGGTRSNLQYQAATATTPTGAWTGLERQFEGFGLQVTGRAQVLDNQRVNWIVGTDIDHAKEQRQGGNASTGEKTGTTRNELNEASNRDYFAQANWSLSERLTLTTGARQSNVTLKSRDDMPVTASDPDGSGSVTYKATSPILGLTWHAQDNLSIYINQGKGFETPTMSEAAYTLTAPSTIKGQFNPNLLASRSNHLEIGTKWLPSPSTRMDAAWFQIRTENEIVTARSSGGKTAYTNASGTTRDGFEFALRHQHNSHWKSQVSATFMNATYDQSFSNFVNGTTNTIAAGNSLSAIPKRQLFGSLQWSEKGFANPGQRPALGLEAGIDLISRSRMWANDANSSTASDYALAQGFSQLNARVRQRYQWGNTRIEAFIGVDNLTNKDTISSVIVNQSSKQYFEPGLPRSWIVGVQSQIPL